MSISVRDNGIWKPAIGLSVRDNGVWKPVVRGLVKDNGAWKEFYAPAGGGGGGPASVVLSPNPADGFTGLNNFNNSGYVSVSITATASNFNGTPTYSWTRISGPSGQGAFSATGVNTATVLIFDTVSVFVDWQETWRCTVSDGTNTVSADVVVTLRCDNLS